MIEKVLKSGVVANYKCSEHKIIRVHSIEDDYVIYEVNGPFRRLLADFEFDFITQKDKEFTQVVPIWHYALDFDSGTITENKAFGIVFGDKIAVYSPDFKGYLTEANIRQGKVSKSFNMFLIKRNPDKARIDITKAVSDRYKFYKAKADSYSKILDELG